MNKKLLLMLTLIISLLALYACAENEQAADATNAADNIADEEKKGDFDDKSNDESEYEESTASETSSFGKADAADVKKALKTDNAIVLDARINGSYIGWTLAENNPGGHIKGASDFSARWLDSTYSDKENLEEETRASVLAQYLKNKGINADTEIIVYDAGGGEAVKTAEYLRKEGVKDISLFNINDWPDELEKYPRYQLLVPAENVKKLIEGAEVESFDADAEYNSSMFHGVKSITRATSTVMFPVRYIAIQIGLSPKNSAGCSTATKIS